MPPAQVRARAVTGTMLAVVLCAAGLHVAVLLPWAGSRPGDHPVLDTVTDFVGAAMVVVMAWRRGRSEPRARGMWWCLSAAVAAYLVGTVLFALVQAGLLPAPAVLGSFAGWTAFYLLGYAGLVALLRQQVTRFHPSTWLDGLVAGLAVAACVAAFLVGPVVRATGGGAGLLVRNVAYPVADLLLLVLLAGVLTVMGRRPGRAVGAITVGLVAFAVTDVVFALQSARGTYVDGGLLDLGWVVAQTALAVAACLASPAAPAARWDGLAVLAVPGVAAGSALVLLFCGTLVEVPRAAAWLALLAVTGALVRTGLTFREVRALAETRREARTDELTGLANRRAFAEALAAETSATRPWRGTAVLMIDLDRFKDINDSLGHATGDELLRLVAQRLRGLVRPSDLLARLGGDEFAVLARAADARAAEALGRRLRATLSEPFVLRGVSLVVDASVGVCAPPERTDGDQVLQMADIAMYAAKARRSGTHVYDEELDGHGRHRLELVEQLRAGIERGELVLHYQPKVQLPGGAVTEVEALVRWQHPVQGLLAPDRFVDLAESAGLMGTLTRSVLDQALDQVSRWRRAGLHLGVAVNVSPWSLVDPGFPERVTELLDRYGLPGSALVLEVTETSLMEDREQATTVLSRLRAAGTAIAVDDYGAGYSSLAYLAELPIDELKLDRRFAGAVLGDERVAAVVSSTVQLAHALGLVLVAEGVEDGAVLAALAGQGCDVAQGYHLSRPVPAELVPAACAAATRAVRGPAGRPAPVPAG